MLIVCNISFIDASSALTECNSTNQQPIFNRPRKTFKSWNILPITCDLSTKTNMLASSLFTERKLKGYEWKVNERKIYGVNDHIPLSSLERLRRKRHEKILPRKLHKQLDFLNKSSVIVMENEKKTPIHPVSPILSPPLFYNKCNGIHSKQHSFHETTFSSCLASKVFSISTSTAGSYISGGLFGYIIGSARNLPSLMNGTRLLHSSNKFLITNNSALSQAKSCALLSASFTAFQLITETVRKEDDKWNGIIGSFCTGIYLNHNSGLRKMFQSGITYGGVTYILSGFDRMKGKKMIKEHEGDLVDNL